MSRPSVPPSLAAAAVLLLLSLATPAAPADGPPLRLALTFDDLPWVGAPPAGDGDAAAALGRICAVLRVHGAPATGFVVTAHAASAEASLRAWVGWGNALGNHTAAHRDLNDTPVEAWLADVGAADAWLRRFGPAYRPLLRYPLLHRGDTIAARDAAAAGLRARGLTAAPVTVDNSEWLLARVYGHALATGDAPLRREVAEAFVAHVTAAVAHADRVARRKAGRAVPQVLLLHANALVADRLDALLLALEARGVVFVSLAEALADPVYARADGYAGPQGLSWLYRMEPASPGDAAWDDAAARDIRARFAPALAPDDATVPAAPAPGVAPAVPPGFAAVLAAAATSERLRSLLVMHRGEVVVEAYFHGDGPDTPANLKSVTKSLSSALVGVALARGWIADLDDPVGAYLPESARRHPAQAAVTVRELLTMSSGLAPVDYGAIQQSGDWVDSLLSRPVQDDARGAFRYDTPVLQLLSAVLRAASGLTLREIADRHLLGPLGARVASWRTDAGGLELGGNDAYLRPRDLLLLGELYRRGGRWEGRQVLPATYVAASTGPRIRPPDDRVNHGTLAVRGYGYLWWLLDLDGEPAYAALGHGGQFLVVCPERELVVVMTSRWPGPSATAHYEHVTRLLREDVLPRFPRAR